jgi:hypothetical protein
LDVASAIPKKILPTPVKKKKSLASDFAGASFSEKMLGTLMSKLKTFGID